MYKYIILFFFFSSCLNKNDRTALEVNENGEIHLYFKGQMELYLDKRISNILSLKNNRNYTFGIQINNVDMEQCNFSLSIVFTPPGTVNDYLLKETNRFYKWKLKNIEIPIIYLGDYFFLERQDKVFKKAEGYSDIDETVYFDCDGKVKRIETISGKVYTFNEALEKIETSGK